MGDMADDFAAMKAHRQEQHRNWKQKNLAALSNTNLMFAIVNDGETVLFRERDKPRVDFYPSTGRWRIVGGNNSKTFRGGAESFLKWYAKQKV